MKINNIFALLFLLKYCNCLPLIETYDSPQNQITVDILNKESGDVVVSPLEISRNLFFLSDLMRFDMGDALKLKLKEAESNVVRSTDNLERSAILYEKDMLVFIDSSFKTRDRLDEILRKYRGTMHDIDFRKARKITREIYHSKIVLDDLDNINQFLLLTQTVYKGCWINPTAEGPIIAIGENMIADTFVQRNVKRKRCPRDICDILKLPYNDGLDMLLVIPKSFDAWNANVTIRSIKYAKENDEWDDVVVRIPKFNVTYQYDIFSNDEIIKPLDISTAIFHWELLVRSAVTRITLRVDGTECNHISVGSFDGNVTPDMEVVDPFYFSILKDDQILMLGKINELGHRGSLATDCQDCHTSENVECRTKLTGLYCECQNGYFPAPDGMTNFNCRDSIQISNAINNINFELLKSNLIMPLKNIAFSPYMVFSSFVVSGFDTTELGIPQSLAENIINRHAAVHESAWGSHIDFMRNTWFVKETPDSIPPSSLANVTIGQRDNFFHSEFELGLELSSDLRKSLASDMRLWFNEQTEEILTAKRTVDEYGYTPIRIWENGKDEIISKVISTVELDGLAPLQGDNVYVSRIPLAGEKTLTVVMPLYDIVELENNLTQEDINHWIRGDMPRSRFNITELPLFDIKFQGNVLISPRIFGIYDMFQRVFLKISPDIRESNENRSAALLFNRPFLYFLTENESQTILLSGRLYEPEGVRGSVVSFCEHNSSSSMKCGCHFCHCIDPNDTMVILKNSEMICRSELSSECEAIPGAIRASDNHCHCPPGYLNAGPSTFDRHVCQSGCVDSDGCPLGNICVFETKESTIGSCIEETRSKCFKNPCGSMAECVPYLNTYECRCGLGKAYILENDAGKAGKCENICTDEVKQSGEYGILNGMSVCGCMAGYSHKNNDYIQCYKQCVNPDDCEESESCVSQTLGSVCLRHCTGNTDCVDNLVCSEGYCTDPCENNPCNSVVNSSEVLKCVTDTSVESKYRCLCNQGYSNFNMQDDIWNPHLCFDIDECETDASFCQIGEVCKNTDGSAVCENVCDMHECNLHGDVDALCVPQVTGHICRCSESKGYNNINLQSMRDDLHCFPGTCGSECTNDGVSRCVSTGEFTSICQCPEGYENMPNNSQRCRMKCTCGQHRCIRYSDTEYQCLCDEGFTNYDLTSNSVDLRSCFVDPCYRNTCQNDGDIAAECHHETHEENGYTCICTTALGYTNTDWLKNYDKNRCFADPCYGHSCTHDGDIDAQCEPTSASSYRCICSAGIALIQRDTTRCVIGVCEGKCLGHSCRETEDVEHGYSCVCNTGFTNKNSLNSNIIDPYNCFVDYCHNNTCNTNGDGEAKCVAGNSSYTCACSNGYMNIDNVAQHCIVDPCFKNKCNYNGDQEATCDAIDSESYKCRCSSNFLNMNEGTVDMAVCIDPCEGNPCGNHYCIRDEEISRGYRCECDAGYSNPVIGGVKLSHECRDPCEGNPCEIHRCIRDEDISRGYRCECNAGYSNPHIDGVKQSHECHDPCEGYPCGIHRCVIDQEIIEGYRCQCNENYSNVNQDGVEIGQQCYELPCLHNRCNASGDSNAECYNTSPYDSECRCSDGYQNIDMDGNTDMKQCRSICGTDACEGHICVLDYTLPSLYRCLCREGYDNVSEDGRIVHQKCFENRCLGDPCGENMDCQRSPNAIKCVCKSGYSFYNYDTLVEDRSKCSLDPCVTNHCEDDGDVGATCLPLSSTTYSCQCSSDFGHYSKDSSYNTARCYALCFKTEDCDEGMECVERFGEHVCEKVNLFHKCSADGICFVTASGTLLAVIFASAFAVLQYRRSLLSKELAEEEEPKIEIFE